jgi:heparin binding hemagglutinin HbhA
MATKSATKKIEIPTEVSRPIYAYVGATDLAVEYVRGTVAEVPKFVNEVQKDVSDRVSTVQETVKNLAPRAVRRRVTAKLDETASSVTDTYVGLAERGEKLVVRIRNQESTQATASSARTTTAKARTTRTQATKAADTTTTTARKQGSAATKTAKTNADSAAKTAKSKADSTASATRTAAKKTTTTATKSSAPARSSAKATTTSASKTAGNATQAVTDAAKKVGD